MPDGFCGLRSKAAVERMARTRCGRAVLHKAHSTCRKGRLRMAQQPQGKQAAACPRGKVQAVQRSQQGVGAVGAGYHGKGCIARQRSACGCCIGCIIKVIPRQPACSADMQHAQPLKAGVALMVKGVVLRAVQGGFHLVPMGCRQLSGLLCQM